MVSGPSSPRWPTQPKQRNVRSRPVPFEPTHSAYADTHNSAYISTQHQSSIPDQTHLCIPSDLTKWLVDTGATAHTTPCLTEQTHVENDPDVYIEVAYGTPVPCKGKSIDILN
jgi:hypothetical protein